jgi:hypothetical protein
MNKWKRKQLKLLVRAKGVIGYDRRKARRRASQWGGSFYGDCGKTICELFEELRKEQQNKNYRPNRRLL